MTVLLRVKSSTGKIAFNYIISTPSFSSAKSINKNLPTLLFIHADPQIRRFNCVAVDLRLHGHTTSDPLPEGYSAKEAAEDLALFMDEIKLPACHIVGLSMGTMVSMGLAVYYPDKVASLFLVSPLGLEELPDVVDGRKEVAECWKEAFRIGQLDMEAISDSLYGAQQLGFSNRLNSLANALQAIAIPLALKSCVPENFEQYDRALIDFLNNRKEYTAGQLSRIRVPVKLVHCLGDIAYPQEYTERFMQQLKNAAVTVSLATIPEAPHFGVVTHGDIINRLLHDFIMDSCLISVPPAPREVSSPWEAELIKAGWKEGEGESGND
ncbi:alpha/beta-hydrolase [Desarmillaria ectypa]|nr:alpha/beta-hydrolase [Desarmillaria ectypa]